MDPQRIHPAYWHDRPFKAKAMGLNTIFAYVFWDLIEPERGSFDFTGRNDVASYFRQAQQVGLNVVLRPGSYAYAERDWGGFPAWLLTVVGMEVGELFA
jgi:beta-galactosidase GanA